MLPPGVPFPTKKAPATNVQPCLGCGKTDHWLADCQVVPARLKELALEGFRTRKAVRRVKLADAGSPSPLRLRPGALLTAAADDDDQTSNSVAPEESVERESKEDSL